MNSTSSGIANTALASTETGGLSNLTNRFALDTQGFDALRAQANASPQQGLKAAAKQFVAFLLDEANLTPYVEGSLGRWFPVTKAAQQSPFWKADAHRQSVYNQFMNGTVPFEFTKNYKFTVLNNENVWAKAANRVLNEKVPIDKATDEMIARIKAVASN